MKYTTSSPLRVLIASASLLVSFTLQTSATCAAESALPVKDKWAVVIGISKFKDGSIDLKYPAKDAQDFSKFLVERANFAPDHVQTLIDSQATREEILDMIGDKWLPRVARPDDLVVIYVSTHGSPSSMDIGGVNYLVAHDTDKERLYSTGLAMQDLCKVIRDRVHASRTLILLDACHSGATSPDGKGIVRKSNVDADEIAQGTGQTVICSSAPDQISWESKEAKNSVFTRRLIESFTSKGGATTVDDAYNYLKDQVEQEVLRDRGQMQTPVMRSKWQGDALLLSVRPSDPKPGLKIAPPKAVSESDISSARATSAVVPPVVAKPLRPTTPSTPRAAVTGDSDAAYVKAEQALRAHFLKMSRNQAASAFNDFSKRLKSANNMTLARYQVTVARQKYLPAVADLPASAFRRGVSREASVEVYFDEKPLTGIDMCWRYSLVKDEGVWLIDNYKVISRAAFNSL